MLTFEQMLVRFLIALVLGAVLGIERELVEKRRGGRAHGNARCRRFGAFCDGGALASLSGRDLSGKFQCIISSGGFLGMIAGVTSGIGFLGAGIIIKINDHPHGVTTAALVWATAALGVLVGIGLIEFAATAGVLLAVILYCSAKNRYRREAGATGNGGCKRIIGAGTGVTATEVGYLPGFRASKNHVRFSHKIIPETFARAARREGARN